MKLLERIAEKFTKTAAVTAKKEVRKSLVDFVPGVLTLGTMLLGLWIFRDSDSGQSSDEPARPMVSRTQITNNNFFLGDLSEDLIQKVLEAYLDE